MVADLGALPERLAACGATFEMDGEEFATKLLNLRIGFVQLDQLINARRSPVGSGKDQNELLLPLVFRNTMSVAADIDDLEIRSRIADLR